MLKLNKKVFFTGLTLAILAPIAAQSAGNGLLSQMEVGYCDLAKNQFGQLVCNPQHSVDIKNTNHKALIQPILNAFSNNPNGGQCTINALTDAWGQVELIKQRPNYIAAMKNYTDACVGKPGKKAPALPHPVIEANMSGSLVLNRMVKVEIVGKIVGPDGSMITDLFSDQDHLVGNLKTLSYESEATKVSADDDAVTCSKEKGFVDKMTDKPDSDSDDEDNSAIGIAASKLSQKIQDVADHCKDPSKGKSAKPSLSDLSDEIVPSGLQEIHDGGAAQSGSGA